MTVENKITTILRPSLTLSGGNFEGRRNRTTRVLNALLSASALGVFLEGCGANPENIRGNETALVPQESGDALTNSNNLPDSSTDDNPPDSSTDDNPPDGSTDDNPPDGSTDDNPPDSSTDDNPSDSSTDDNPPDGSTDDNPPDGSTDDNPPDSSTDDNPPDGSTDDNPPDGSTDDNPSDSSTDDNPSDSSTDDNPSDGSTDDNPSDGSTDDNPSDGSTDDNPSDGSTDDNPSDGSTDDNPPDGYVDPDSYIVEEGTTVTISFDPDGGMLLYRDAGNDEVIEFVLYRGNDVSITIGEESVYIESSPALRNGSYSVHVGADDAFFGYLYIGTTSSETLTADDRGTGRLVGFSGDDTLVGNFAADGINGGAGNDELYGFGGSDILRGGSDIDTLQGGIGNDELLGEGGGDLYLFDAGDGNDLIRGESDGLGNKLLFNALSGSTYADADFAFSRGFLRGGKDLAEDASGTDLEIVVSWEGVEQNRVIVQQYFSQGDDAAYTIYRNSLSEEMIVQTAPVETS